MTISIKQLKNVKKIFSHASCYDGTAAAMICARTYSALGLNPDIEFIQYDDEEHEKMEPGPDQLFVDITPPRSRWREWEGYGPIVLDHHESSQEVTDGLGGVFGKNEELKCGAALAYDHVMEPLMRTRPDFDTWEFQMKLWKDFSRLCAVRDTWQEDHEDFERAQGMMRCLGHFGSRSLLKQSRDGSLDLEGMFGLGVKLHENAMWKAKLYAKTAHFEDVPSKGEVFRFGYFNCSEKLASEACHLLLNEHKCDVAFGYFMTVRDDKVIMQVSVRTRKEHQGARIGARVFAEAFGGGGHWPAAGFRFPDAMGFSMADLIQKTKHVLWETRGKG